MIFLIPTNIQDNPDGKDGKRLLLLYIIVTLLTIIPAFYFTKTEAFGTLDERIDIPFIIAACGILFWIFQFLAVWMLIWYIINKIIDKYK